MANPSENLINSTKFDHHKSEVEIDEPEADELNCNESDEDLVYFREFLINIEESNLIKRYNGLAQVAKCGVIRVSRFLENDDEELDALSYELPSIESKIDRVGKYINIMADRECTCPLPSVQAVIDSIQIDPYIQEEREKVSEKYGRTIRSLRMVHNRVNYLNYRLESHHYFIENLMQNIVALSERVYHLFWTHRPVGFHRETRRRPYYG